MGRPDVDQAGRRAGVRAVPASSCASTRTSGRKVSCPERLSRQRPAGARRRAQRLPRRRAVRPPRRRDVPRPRAVGHRLAAPEPEGPHARRRAAGRLHPAHRADARAAAASCWSTTRCASTGPRSDERHGARQAVLDVPGTTIFDAEQSRKGYWLNQFCMSLMKAENRARFKADERAYLDEWPMTEEQKQAVLDARPEPLHRGGRQHLFPGQDRRHRRQELPADGRRA